MADLGAFVTPSQANPRAGKRLKFALGVTNFGPSPVPGVTIQAAISGGSFTGLRLPKVCSGTEAAIVCTTGKVPSGRRPVSKKRTISLIPAAGATITVTATVSSPVYDPNPANQTAAFTSMVP